MQPVIYPIEKKKLIAELTEEHFMRKTNKGGNEIYTFDAHSAPNLMQEVGRIRELTFRSAGGGTGKETDIDEFDVDPQTPYQQLIVWDPQEQEIIGGYRYILCGDNRTFPFFRSIQIRLPAENDRTRTFFRTSDLPVDPHGTKICFRSGQSLGRIGSPHGRTSPDRIFFRESDDVYQF